MLLLTARDHELIQEQCELQNATSVSQLAGFRQAYKIAKNDANALKSWDTLDWEVWISWLALRIESCNERYRRIPVTFADGSSGIPWQSVPRAMVSLCTAIESGSLTPLEAYREFETIHPFEDGNGRVGHLLWAAMTQYVTGVWPETLPPKLW